MTEKLSGLSLIRKIRNYTLGLLILLVTVFSLVIIIDHLMLFNDSKTRAYADFLNTQSEHMKSEILSVSNLIYNFRDLNLQNEEILSLLRNLKFGSRDNGYFSVVGFDGTVQLNNRQPKSEGNSIWDQKDTSGVRIIQKARKAADNPDGDFIYYSLYDPLTGKNRHKMSYIKGIPELDWMISTDIYLDSIEKESSELQKQIFRDIGIRLIALLLLMTITILYIYNRFRRFSNSVSGDISVIDASFIQTDSNSGTAGIANVKYDEFSLIAMQINKMNAKREKADKEKTKYRNDLSAKNIELQKSLEEKQVLLKEVHHRVKNNMAIISSLLSLQAGSIEDEKFQNLIQSSQNRIKSMAMIHEQLYKSESLKNINIKKYLADLIDYLISTFGYVGSQVSLYMDVIDMDLELDLLIPLGMIFNEILSNAFKHAFTEHAKLELTVTLERTDEKTMYLNIFDNGSGFNNDNTIKGEGIGLMLIEGLVDQIDGELRIDTNNRTSYEITFKLPE